MKWMIASDLHGSAYWCEKMIERYWEEKAGKLLLLGDILYHGPRNDLPRDYAPKRVIEMLNNSCCASAATVTARWTRWCCSSPSWPITPRCG